MIVKRRQLISFELLELLEFYLLYFVHLQMDGIRQNLKFAETEEDDELNQSILLVSE